MQTALTSRPSKAMECITRRIGKGNGTRSSTTFYSVEFQIKVP